MDTDAWSVERLIRLKRNACLSDGEAGTSERWLGMFEECISPCHGHTRPRDGRGNEPPTESALVAATLTTGDRQNSLSNKRSLSGGNAVISELVSVIHTPRSGPEYADKLFRTHVSRALVFCLAGTRDGLFLREGNKGGLALWQLERATEIMQAHVGRRICLSTVARECGLTVSHFARAFKVSTGVAPSQWLLDRRIAMAKRLLSTTPKKLSEIALDCGFTDQSHFTRVFGRRVGVSPGRWRATLAADDRLTSAPERASASAPFIGGEW
jgi:AraC-like DNA-binding protein